MKIIFLDIDGVLVNRKSLMERPRPHRHSNADPDCVAALNHIAAETGAGIVVSSVWRIGRTRADLREIVNSHFGVIGSVLDKTPHMTTKKDFGTLMAIEVSAERGDEIDYWLRSDHRWPIESFAILDDDDDMGIHKGRLVKTEFEPGLTMADAERAIRILNHGVAKRPAESAVWRTENQNP